MPVLKRVNCRTCKKKFYKDIGHVNENLKLGHNFYCSKTCKSRNKNKQKHLTCENPGCDKTFFRPPNDISPHNFCSRGCAALVSSKITAPRRVKFKVCAVCKIEFSRKDRASGYKFCSVDCKNKSMIKYAPEELLKTIQTTAEKIKRAPAKRELKEIVECRVRVFGSWNDAIIAAGLTPNRSHSQRMYKRVITKASDGHLCDSVSEAVIDNWFAKHEIEHTRDKLYPVTNHKVDWVIGNNVFVEYFGLAKDSPRYDRAIKKKRSICRKYGVCLIEIYPNDLYPKVVLENKLNNFISI